MERNGDLEIVIAKLTDVESLEKAFEGCRGVFHTSAFTDPAGLSGYTVSFFLSLLSLFIPFCVPYLPTLPFLILKKLRLNMNVVATNVANLVVTNYFLGFGFCVVV